MQGHSDAQFVVGYALQQSAAEDDVAGLEEAVKMYTLAGITHILLVLFLWFSFVHH